MQRSRFVKVFLERLQETENEINNTKGREYCSGDDDTLANFKAAAKLVKVTCPHCTTQFNLSPAQIALVYKIKGFLAICTLVEQAGETISSEKLEDRFADDRLYAALIWACLDEATPESTPEFVGDFMDELVPQEEDHA